MACINDKGSLTESAKKLLTSIKNESLNPEEISKRIGLPLFKVRSSLRDMKSMGFVLEENDTFKMNPKAEKLLIRN